MLASKNCTYNITYGLVDILMKLTKLERQEIWSMLADETQVCFDRFDKNENQTESWRWFDFPDTDVRMKIKVNKDIRNRYNSKTGVWTLDSTATYSANIKMDGNRTEKFTSKQVEEFLVENILLGVKDA